MPADGAEIRAVDERQPVQIDAEHQDEEQPGEERRQREADERQRAGDLIEDRVGPRGGKDADRNGDQDRQDLRRADDEQRRRQPLQDQLVDVHAADEREAPVALRHRRDPAHVAHRHRVIEPELGAQSGAHFRRHGRIGGQLLERIAGRQRQHREQHDADAEQARDGDEEAPDQIVPHHLPSRSGSAACLMCSALTPRGTSPSGSPCPCPSR